jgi:hypothetical protein
LRLFFDCVAVFRSGLSACLAAGACVSRSVEGVAVAQPAKLTNPNMQVISTKNVPIVRPIIP